MSTTGPEGEGGRPDRLLMEFDVPMATRDGVTLRANVLQPADGAPHPVALCRTPYGKDAAGLGPILDPIRLARAGYVVIVQDVRGRGASEGEWAPFLHEAEDGHDAVGWAASLPGSSGAVGMFGASYVGFTQWAAALGAPHQLKAIVPAVTWADVRDGFLYRGGAFELGVMADWQLQAVGLETVRRRHRGSPPEEGARALRALAAEVDRLPREGYGSLPVEVFEPLSRFGLAGELLESVARREAPAHYSPFEERARYERVSVPSLNVGGWYDVFLGGTLCNFSGVRALGATPEARRSRLLVGPWSHVNFSGVVGEHDFGLAASLSAMDLRHDLTDLTRRWFDRWLKGVEDGVEDGAPVRLFVMGENVWRDEREWPLERTRYAPLYLREGDGLAYDPPGEEPPDRYVYDPARPTPTLGGAVQMNPVFGAGVRDQRPLEARSDVLVYTGAPLERDLEVTGPVRATLWVSSDAPEVDVVARLVDVHPDGFSRNLADGIVRAGRRVGGAGPRRLEIDLWATANVFKAGHRLRVHVASASFPRWDRGLSGDAALEPTARVRVEVWHDAERPSHVLLPVIPR